jgi:TetR/AcrR family transcriptional regulator, upper aerobic nicotinate degradation pathway regulator
MTPIYRRSAEEMTRKVKQKARPAQAAHRGVRTKGQAAKLMTVAMDLFCARDFASVTIKDIANAADVNSALIYYYFKDKEDLFRVMIEHAISQALDNYTRLKARHSNPTDLINDWFENNIEMAELMRKLVKIMIDYSHSSTRVPSIETLIRRFYKMETGILSTGVREGIARGIFRNIDPERTALFISVHLDGIMAASMVRPKFDIVAAMDELRSVFWQRVSRSVDRAA